MTGKKSGGRKLLTRFAVLAALACVAAGGAISASYAVKPVIIDQGGGRAMGSAYALGRASIGGPVIGTSSSGSYTIDVHIRLDAGPITPPEPEAGRFVSFTGGGCSPSGADGTDRADGADGALAALLALAVVSCLARRRRVAAARG